MTLKMKPYENVVGKGENAGNQHFLLFPQGFPPFPKQVSVLSSATVFNFVQSKIRMFGEELILQQ